MEKLINSEFTKTVFVDTEKLDAIIGGMLASGGDASIGGDTCGTSVCEDCCDCDSVDVHSELASGGGTTDSYQ